MKKPTIFKTLLAIVFVLLSLTSYAQLRKDFKSRYTTSLNGDILVIGNNLLNRDNGTGQRPNNPYNDTGSGSEVNDRFVMKYIDIDNESTFNSSSATLTIPQASKTCFEIVYAALYWSGTYQGTDRSKINQIKLKTSAAGAAYKTITGDVLWDEGGTGVDNAYESKPYACFKEITTEVKAAGQGVYTVADLLCSEGKFSPGGNSAGWSIFVIYKDPLLPSKYITSFDGFSIIRSSDPPLDIPISGFRTNPFGDVNVKLAFSALEGDNKLTGDGLEIKGGKSATWGAISSLVRPIEPGRPATVRPTRPAVDPIPNFFNSTITDGDILLPGRNPNSINTLGYDAGVVKVDNNGNNVIQNDETDATLRISTSSDAYYMFFNALSVEIIAPKIVVRKNVLDKDDKNIGTQPVNLDQELRYELKFKNEGNDNAKNFTITDVLPNNVIFNGLSDIMFMDAGITAAYNAATRTLVFTVPNNMVVSKALGGAEYTIKFKVRVVKDCNELVDACSNEIKNTAVSKYYGDKNTSPEGFGEGSYSTISECNVGEPTSTNFLVGIDKCLFSRDVSLCGTAVLTAANGYTKYVWKDPNGVIFGGNNRQVTIDKPGTYTVDNSGAVNCAPIQQRFVVTDYLAGTNKSPIKGDNIDPATGEAFACVRDLKPFPKIFLCGLNDKRIIDTKITTAASIVWQETTDVPPVGSPNPDSCPYEGATNWTTIGNGPVFTADRKGVFRLVINYGNTCVVIHYFNVYQNTLETKAEKQDIICDTKGKIIVTSPAENSGYSYSLDGVTYQTSSVFDNVPKGNYKVQIRQTELIGGQISTCPFFVDVDIQQLDFKTTLVATHPICTADKGTIKVVISNVPGQYKFILRKKGSTVDIQNTGLIDNNYNTFTGVDPGVYEVYSSTSHNGCNKVDEIEVFDYRLTAEAKLTKSLTGCADGEITVTVKGGTPRPGPPPYYMYYINGNVNYVTDPKIVVTSATLPTDGIYNIVVVDDKGCTVTIPPIKVTEIPKPTITVTQKDVNCYGVNEGEIGITVSPADSGYAVSYSINNGAFSSISPITKLAAATYSLVVKYVYNTIECLDAPRTIKILGPAEALTASAGVSELAGCGAAGEGKIRITNPQGGVGPYTYSFDNQKTWVTNNDEYKAPGTYTVYIKDSKGCIYAMPGIRIDQPPVAPIIKIDAPVTFNCDGSAKTTVTVNNPGGANFEYNYYLDDSTTPNTNVPPNVFPNVPSGDHKVRIEYKVISVPTFSNLLNENFGYGDDVPSPGINTTYYCFERQVTATQCKGSIEINDGDYSVTAKIVQPFGPWLQPGDHTPPTNPATPRGRALVVNIGDQIPVTAVLYEKTIKDIIPGQPINFEFFGFNLLNKNNNQADPNLTIALVNAAGVEISSFSTGSIPKSEKWESYPKTPFTLDPGANTTLRFIVRSNVRETSGNDVAIDDIKVFQLPKSCKTTLTIPFSVPTGKAFTASAAATKEVSCATGAADGEITITATNFDPTNGYQYSINGGTTWLPATTSPFVIKGLSAGLYSVKMRYDSTAAGSACVSSSTPTIKAPDTIVVGATVITPAKCSVGATIEASGTGGSGAYKYQLQYAAGGIYRIFQDSNTFLDVPAGDYFVFIKDIKDCVSPAGKSVKVDAPPAVTVDLDIATDYCYNATTKATLVVKAGGGTGIYSYSLDGAAGQPSNIFTNVGLGLHKIVVTDAYGCKSPELSVTIEPEMVVTPSIKTLDCSSPTTKDAIITGTITGGYLPFTITKVSGPAGGTLVQPSPAATGRSFTYTTSVAGDYEFQIKDFKGCIKTLKVKIDPITDPEVEALPSPISCNGLSDGSVFLTGKGGSGGYTYSDNATTGFSAQRTYSALTVGNHTFYVKDSKGCVGQVIVEIKQPDAVAGTVKILPAYTCISGATITAVGSGGNGSYTYILKRGTTTVASNTTGEFKNLTVAGTYSVTITDAKNCSVTINAGTIDALTPPTSMTFDNSALKCPSNLVDVTIKTVTGGKGKLSYAITAPAALARPYQLENNVFIGLAPGTYTFTVKDENECTFSDDYVIAKLPVIGISSSVVNNVKCLGDANGSVKYTISGFGNNTPYSYTVDGGTANTGLFTPATGTSFDIIVSGLTAGDHEIVVVNGTTNCEVTKKETVKAPATLFIITNPTLSPVTCLVNGKAVINVSGGWGSYEYTVTPVNPAGTPVIKTTNTFDDLAAGDYSVSVKDLNGCLVTQNFTIAGKTPIVAKIDVTTNLCYTTGGVTIKVDPNTQTNYVYNIIGRATQSNGTFTGLNPGKYTIRVTDTATGCYIDLDEQTVATELTATANLFAGPKCNTPNVVFKGQVSGGTAAYSYVVSIDGTLESPATTHNITAADGTYTYTDASGIPAGKTTPTVYVFTFTDSKGCTVTATRTVQPKTNPAITSITQVDPVYCSADLTGSFNVVLDLTKGASPYVITVLNTDTNFDYGTQTSGLPIGKYLITVTDANGCKATEVGEIKGPKPIIVDKEVIPITCDPAGGVSKGSIIIKSVTGGTPNYTYHVTGYQYDKSETSNGGTSVVFNIVDFGLYQVKITDANNCLVEFKDVLVASPPNKLDITVTSPPANCTTGGSATVAVGSAFSGNGPFYFSIYKGTVVPFPSADWVPETTPGIPDVPGPGVPGSKQATFTDLTPGVTYTFVVYDSASKCYYFETKATPIPTNSTLKTSAIVPSNVTCKGQADGNVKFTVSSTYTTATTISYEIFDAFTRITTGVTGTGTVPLNGNFTFTSPKLNFGNYYVLIKETGTSTNAGCSVATIPFVIRESSTDLLLFASSGKNANCNPNAGLITASGQGGTVIAADNSDPLNIITAVPYLYQIFPDNGAIGEDGADVRPLAGSFSLTAHTSNTFHVEAGNYLVYVRDAYGCIQSAAVTVKADPQPVITAVASGQCTAAEGSFGIDVVLTTAGIGTHTYSVDGGDFVLYTGTSFTIPNLSSGTHKVKVKDANGCGNEVLNIIIAPPLDIDASFTKLPTCKNADGTITATVTGGSGAANYEFTLVNNTTATTYPVQSTGIFTLKEAGNYTVTVKDLITNCSKSEIVDLLIPTDVTFTLSNTAPYCTTGQGDLANGTVTVNLPATNVNIPYSFTLTRILPLPVGTPLTQSTTLFTGLTAGTYSVTVKSDRGCEFTDTTVIVPPVPVSATITQDDFLCNGADLKDKIITITPAGGKGAGVITNYKYKEGTKDWVDTNTFSVIDNGSTQTIKYYVKDANNCIYSEDVIIAPFPVFVSAVATKINPTIDCVNKQQDIEVIITGGTNTPKPFTYQAYQDGVAIGGLVTVTADRFTYPALTAGSYYEFEIIDNNTTCSIKTNAVSVPVFNKMKVEAIASSMVDCKGNATGAIEINIIDYAGPYNYEILKGGVSLTPALTGTGDSTTTSSFILPNGLLAGNDYTVVVTQTAYPSCDVTSKVVEITEPDAIDLSGLKFTNVNKNCNSAGSVVTIDLSTVKGGTPDYTFAFVERGTSPIGFYKPEHYATLDPATNTLWDIYVKDSKGCSDKFPLVIAADESPKDLAVNAFDPCPSPTGTYTFIISATTVGGAEYSIGNGFYPTGTFTVDNSGTYHVTVRDKNGCTNPLPFDVVILERLQLDAPAVTLPNCNTATGVVTLSARGGNVTVPSSYEYSIDGVTYIDGTTSLTPNVFENLAPNSYTFYVRDKVTKCVASQKVTIENATIITGFKLEPTAVSCFSYSDGTITAVMDAPSPGVNDNPDYKYTIDGGAPQDTPVFKGLAAGPHTVTVTSGRGCPAQATISVPTPAIIVVPVPDVVQFKCNTGTNTSNFATITVDVPNVTGGSNDYKTFEFIKVGTPNEVHTQDHPVYTEYNTAGGTYIVNVYDSKGCVGTAATTVEIKPFIGIDIITIDVTKEITCESDQEIKVSVSHTGAIAPTNLEYTLVDVDAAAGTSGTLYPKQTNTDGIFTGLPVAFYLVTVTNLDTGCSVATNHYVNSRNTFELKIDNIVNVTCFTDNNGSADVTFIDKVVTTTPLNPDEAGPFAYSVYDEAGLEVTKGITTNAGPLHIANLLAGTYRVVAKLTGSPFCEVSESFTIDKPTAALSVTKLQSEITCVAGNNDGVISVTATGGWSSDYRYELRIGTTVIKPYDVSPVFDKLIEGDYTVYVKDNKDCEVSIGAKLVNPTPLDIQISGTPKLDCFDNEDGVVTINTTTGGSGNYTFTLHGVLTDGTITTEQLQAGNKFTDLKAGTYYVTVNDTWNCNDDSNKVTIDQPELVKGTLTTQSIETCLTTPVVRLSFTGGTAPYYYSTDGVGFTGPIATAFVDITLPQTRANVVYKYYVKDSKGCKSAISNSVPFAPVPALDFERLSHTDIKCTGSSTGTITVVAKGGLGDYSYTLLNEAGVAITPAPVQGAPGLFTNLPVGKYRVKITSSDCQIISDVIELTQPDTPLSAIPVATNVTCNGFNNGKITVNATGGTGAYKYAIEPEFRQFFDTNEFKNLKPGFYDILVQDENACFIFLRDVEVKEPDPINVTEVPNSMIPEYCVGDKDGYFEIKVEGGNGPYKYSLDVEDGPFAQGAVGQTIFPFADLVGGKHTVYIIDANDCSSQVDVIMPDSVILKPTFEINYDCVNNSQSNMVTITVDPSNNPADIDYTLDGVGTVQSSNIFTNVTPGDHFVRVRHTNTCEDKTIDFKIKAYDPLTIGLSGGQQEMNIISVTAAGGAPAYEYSFNGEPFTSSNKYKIYKSGDYVVVVRDKNGCTATITIPAIYIDVCLDNYFTPAGATNTTWGPGCTNIYNNLEFSIFDRYGRVIVKYHYGQKWDGRYNGAELPSGDYWYVLKLNDAKDDREFVGHFTLYR